MTAQCAPIVFRCPMVRGTAVLFALVGSLTGPARAATPAMVADLGQVASDSGWWGAATPAGLASVGDSVVYLADDGVHGRELWRTDGTPGGAHRLTDICPGDCPSAKGLRPAVASGVVYLAADDGFTGTELWAVDADTLVTWQVADLSPTGFSHPRWLTAWGDRLAFVASQSSSETGLFVVGPGAAIETLATFTQDPELLTVVGDLLLFSAATVAEGRELWASDGTPAGTDVVVDLLPGPLSGLAGGYQEGNVDLPWLVDGGRLYFAADDGVHGTELWTTDGTAAGTHLVADVVVGAEGSDPRPLVATGGTLFWSADTPAAGRELWSAPLDESSPPTVHEIVPGVEGSSPRLVGIADRGPVFAAFDASHGTEPWVFDLGTLSFELVLDLWPGSDGSLSYWLRLRHETSGDVVFVADDGTHGAELWRTDGTAGGTSMVLDATPGSTSSFVPFLAPSASAPLPGGRFAYVSLEPGTGFELWASDGTAAGTERLEDIDRQTSIVSECFWNRCAELVRTPRSLVFSAMPQASPWHLPLAVVDPAGGELLLPDGLPASWSPSFPQYGLGAAAWAGGFLYFSAVVDGSDEAPWLSDLSAAGTVPVADIAADVPPAIASRVVSHRDVAFLELPGPTYGTYELWRSDGTGPGTFEVGPYRVAASLAGAPVPSLLLFDAAGTTLSEIEDPSDPPVPLATLTGFSGSVVAERPAGPGRERLLFLAGTLDGGPVSLWSWTAGDGLVHLVDGFLPARDGTFPTEWAAPAAFVGDRLVFAAAPPAQLGEPYAEPWASDGTLAGTEPLGDLFPGPSGSTATWLTPVGDRLAFVATSPDRGREVWITDGTALGTYPAVDLVAGPGSSRPRSLVAIDGTLFFGAWTPATGVELWSWTPGSGIPPALLGDLNPGVDSSSPAHLMHAFGRLFFTANDGTHGFELWSMPAGSGIFADDFETADLRFWAPAE